MREVYFKDCKVGMKFKIDRFSYYAKEILSFEQYYSKSKINITAEVMEVDKEDESIYCYVCVNGINKPHYNDWFYKNGKYKESCIPLNLEPIVKKKNNYY